jgi:Zn-dependent M28 family amino/carboxypeptidase
MITIATALSDEVAPWELRVSHSREAEMTWLGKDGRPADESPGLRAAVLFSAQASEALFAGAPKSYAQIRAEAERFRARPRGFRLRSRVTIKSSSVWTAVTSKEVIGLLRGSDSKLKDQYVVLMGHLDHLGVKLDAKPGEDRIYNGALDNAAGIATMLEAARAFAESGERPRRSILFIANTAEERGLLGAGYFARNPTVPSDSMVAVVDLDMPLLLYDFTDIIAFGAEHSTVARAVARAAKSMGIAVSPDPMPEQNIFVRSDHYRFVEQGIPAILLATGFANGGEAKWRDFLNNIYHDVDDDLHQPINWEAGARYARLNYLISLELADSTGRPRWYAGDIFGETYAPRAPKAQRRR